MAPPRLLTLEAELALLPWLRDEAIDIGEDGACASADHCAPVCVAAPCPWWAHYRCLPTLALGATWGGAAISPPP